MSQKDENKRINNGEFEAIKSAIPEHLISESTPAERHMVSTVSILEQRTNMLHQNVQSLDAAIGELEDKHADLNGKVGELEEIRNKVRWGWKGLTIFFLAVSGLVAFAAKVAGFIGGLLK